MEFHGNDGQPLSLNLKNQLDLRQLGVVTVKGTIRKTSRGIPIVVVDAIHIPRY